MHLNSLFKLVQENNITAIVEELVLRAGKYVG